MRRVPALFVAAGLIVATLSGCSAPAGQNCIVQPGSASQLVSVTGTFGKKQNVQFPTPLPSSTLQRSTISQGTGTPLQRGQFVEAELTLLNGVTGASEQNGRVGLPLSLSTYPGIGKALQCVPVGSRIAITGTAQQIFGASGVQSTGLSPSFPLVLTVDVLRAFLPKANGTPQPGQPGFPTVVLAPNGRPGIKVPSTPAPKKVEVATLKSGNGQTVTKDKSVIVAYTQVSWADNTVTASSWDQGAPVQWALGTAAQGQTAAPTGTAQALIGSKVGSQLVVIVPADAKTGAAASAYVIDVLGII
ncbi:FKBP-type peptidyl-prolyl cis-trans isomerase [Rathayibacter soli]|uniref:FKBP-type peptidyl-prolyl cis-trans isomerase n=1 Tax=Rathayibacter soli TaxID=3144168 RepID=UPI0027E5496E|nr:peptidylprolyl isomerase [Glaciibacter superstes]